MRNWTRPRSRVRVLEFFPDKVLSKPQETATDVSKYLKEVPNSACNHRLYLVEDFSLDVIEVLGSHFWIDPYIFAAQSSVIYWAMYPDGTGIPRKLFSMQCPTQQFTLRYLEFNVLRERNQQYNIHHVHTDANLSRLIYFDKLFSDHVFFVRRNASSWTEKTPRGWNSQ
jgi:hypothetical protein